MSKQANETQSMSAKLDSAAEAVDKEQKKKNYDEKAAGELFGRLNAELTERATKAKEKATALKNVKVEEKDVDVVAHELGLSKDAARTKLQEKNGNLKQTLTSSLYLGEKQ